MTHPIEAELKHRASHSKSLDTRLDLNRKYQSKDFHQWLHRRLDVGPGEHILDVGCGTGAQSLRFLEAIGESGTVSAVDISASSITQLTDTAGGDARLQAVVADMADLDQVIAGQLRQKQFTLAQSSYAIYYSPARVEVIRTMANALATHGRLALFVPGAPHGMVEIAARYSAVPPSVTESLSFGPTVLEPEFRSLFWEVAVHWFQSEMRVTSVDDFVAFYKATTYYDPGAEAPVREHAERAIGEQGFIAYEKNGYLIIGRDRRRPRS